MVDGVYEQHKETFLDLFTSFLPSGTSIEASSEVSCVLVSRTNRPFSAFAPGSTAGCRKRSWSVCFPSLDSLLVQMGHFQLLPLAPQPAVESDLGQFVSRNPSLVSLFV